MVREGRQRRPGDRHRNPGSPPPRGTPPRPGTRRWLPRTTGGSIVGGGSPGGRQVEPCGVREVNVAVDAHHRSPFRLRKALPMHQTRADSQRGIGTSGSQLKVKIAVSDDSVIRCWFLVTRCCLSTCTCPGLLRIGGLLPPFWLSNTACCSGVGDGSAGSRE